ncbi:MAG: HD domain-containing protein [Gemmatimonadetes bacterium]|nr:HD domain-containing protein [Gemmatimonadota bacterium]MBT6146059.1 HD domain-containing protein [Gemmatimonadota bacterium]MBT7858693.1 HD domain-containing protein [Gemmatimonadota bacterium]
MLRSSRQARHLPSPTSPVLPPPPLPPPEAEAGELLQPVEEQPATDTVVAEQIPSDAPPETATEDNPARTVFDDLTQAAASIFAAAEADAAPEAPMVVAAVRAALHSLESGDQLLTETVRRRSEADSWSHRSANVAIMAMRLGRGVHFDERRNLALGLCGLMHDLGMLTVPEEVLSANRLSPEQLKSLRQHPVESQRIVRTFGKAFDWIAKVVVQVHERHDGSGYPMGLVGEEIHEFARIIGLVDTYEAMAQPRADRQARVVYNALKEIIDQRNSLFERSLIKALIDIVSIFPLGSLVKLNNGEIGRVVGTSRLHPTRPTVDILVDPRGRRLPEARLLNLQDEPMLYIVDPAIEEGVLTRS